MGKKKEAKPRKLNRKDQSLKRLENFKKEIVTDHHTVPIDVLCSRLETDIERGLSQYKARQLFMETGPNALTPSRKTPEYIKFIKTITEGFSLLLWIGASLCIIAAVIEYVYRKKVDTDNLLLAAVLVLIIIMTGIFMYYQQNKSSKIMDSFATMIPQKAEVIRDGQQITVNVKDLVVGDLVDMKFGDRIPADVRITKSQGFKVDNSSITGENEPLLRTNQCTNENILETRNVAFFSTNAVEGTAQGIVIMCGDHTVMGKIAGLTARLHPSITPLARELNRFMTIITFWAVILGIIFGVASIAIGYPWIDSALFIIGIIVSNVPEGLLATVTLSLTVTAKKMALKNCLVKNLEAVETLGSTNVVCSDKTGTLTQNKMTVCHLWYNGDVVQADISEDQYDARKYTETPGFDILIRCATLCNRAEFINTRTPRKYIMKWEVRGDASEAAILKFIELTRLEGDPDEFRKAHKKLIELPFNSTSKIQLSIHALANNCLMVMKGAPERILERCKTIFINDDVEELSDELRQTCEKACFELAARGERILGFCDMEMKDTYTYSYPFTIDPLPNFPTEGLRFVGFISLIDPPRPEVHNAVETCKTAGIKVIMVTGDHPVTAKAIAKEVGIITTDSIEDAALFYNADHDETKDAIVVSGTTLRELQQDELDAILYTYNEIVFARTSPTQKLQIVEGLQRLKNIVAVTGDGVNDSPALKKADIGIAMGISGSEVSQQSADMILMDDNFASIITGIEEGRKIFDNLKKSIVYVLASNIAELAPCLMFIVCNIPLPLGILAILCIDVLTDMLPAISLAYEKAESDIMKRTPRNPNVDNLVTFRLYFLAYCHIGVLEACAGFFVYFLIMYEYGFKPNRLFGLRPEWDTYYINDLEDSYGQEWSYEERKQLEYTCSTAFMIAVVVCQWGDVLACKTRLNSIMVQGMTNWFMNVSILIETLLAIFLTYTPYMSYLKFYPVGLHCWLYALPFSGLILLFDEYRKFCIRNYPRGYFYRETYY
ncbi:PREDICTED: sodium/potassium-transporting ATPase subunit alpha-like [Nicrophorus vespilloides]|uniref:Sodium/potassium-transporting ATPase subunit alpha n=1 Tax=Nicrophorus vespilloides TaxID=110193 RepID=A0ABM1N8W9_NICVS|nr:PREDICTED: sodium/potassium-transporting ATPase subunit alpha-like [Nicrophorus vespilloides]